MHSVPLPAQLSFLDWTLMVQAFTETELTPAPVSRCRTGGGGGVERKEGKGEWKYFLGQGPGLPAAVAN